MNNKTIGRMNMKEIVEYFDGRPISLWGIKKPKDYLIKNVHVCIYKYITNQGYLSLWKEISDWYENSHESVAHNCPIILLELQKWEKNELALGNLEEWKNAAKTFKFPKGMKQCNLWMDSNDFALKGKKLSLSKDEYWSFKLKSIGARYQFIFDANLKCIAFWGGYSPKISDNAWLVHHKQELTELFSGATIIADCGYYASRKKVPQVSFITPVPKTVKAPKKSTPQYNPLTEIQKKKNKQIRSIRARVQNPFGQIKNKFRALSNTFKEEMHLLDALLVFAFAIYNKSL
jgi:hypothetical protein